LKLVLLDEPVKVTFTGVVPGCVEYTRQVEATQCDSFDKTVMWRLATRGMAPGSTRGFFAQRHFGNDLD